MDNHYKFMLPEHPWNTSSTFFDLADGIMWNIVDSSDGDYSYQHLLY